MIEEKFLLPEDGERIIKDAASRRWPYVLPVVAPEESVDATDEKIIVAIS
jgi:hypothetical protein